MPEPDDFMTVAEAAGDYDALRRELVTSLDRAVAGVDHDGELARSLRAVADAATRLAQAIERTPDRNR